MGKKAMQNFAMDSVKDFENIQTFKANFLSKLKNSRPFS